MLAYQLGDENAFRELYARHAPKVFGFLRSKIRDEVKARDIFQATFLKLHRNRSRYNSALPFVPWLFTICRNELLDALKKDRRSQVDFVEEVPEQSHAQHTLGTVDLSHLSVIQQKAVDLRFTQDFSFEEIAVALETSPSNARQLVSRALRTLRSFYGKK
jgi:RNA polymerase sigma-70 factor (ECF subfamily)